MRPLAPQARMLAPWSVVRLVRKHADGDVQLERQRQVSLTAEAVAGWIVELDR